MEIVLLSNDLFDGSSSRFIAFAGFIARVASTESYSYDSFLSKIYFKKLKLLKNLLKACNNILNSN